MTFGTFEPTGVEIKATVSKSTTAVINGLRFKGIDVNSNTWSIVFESMPCFCQSIMEGSVILLTSGIIVLINNIP